MRFKVWFKKSILSTMAFAMGLGFGAILGVNGGFILGTIYWLCPWGVP